MYKHAVCAILVVIMGFGNAFTQTYRAKTIHWKIVDREISEQFLNAYLDALTKDERRENQIQASFELFVTAETAGDTVVIKTIEALTPNHFYYKLLSSVLNRIPDMVEMLKTRNYEWDNVNIRKKGNIHFETDVRNVFEERNYKECRDVFWWTYRGFKFAPGLSSYVRPKQFPNYAFEVDFGRKELGFPGGTMKTMNIGVVNEIAEVFLTLPVSYFTLGSFKSIQSGKYGFGTRFDSPNFGGSVAYQETAVKTSEINEDVNKRIYNNWSGQLYFSNTFNVARSASGDSDSTAKKSFRFPPTSLRVKAGMGYMDMLYLAPNDTTNLVNEYRLENPLDNFHFLIKLEFASDLEGKGSVNKHVLALQSNLWLGGLGNIQINYSYAYKEYFNVGLVTLVYWNSLEFKDSVYNWKPGWMIMPVLTLSF
ncbi:hypothetical protein JW960_03330 [candidate division KSB1 bacterium]|nr:hypothetical protein [candidate division KSB1 bacterium]